MLQCYMCIFRDGLNCHLEASKVNMRAGRPAGSEPFKLSHLFCKKNLCWRGDDSRGRKYSTRCGRAPQAAGSSSSFAADEATRSALPTSVVAMPSAVSAMAPGASLPAAAASVSSPVLSPPDQQVYNEHTLIICEIINGRVVRFWIKLEL